MYGSNQNSFADLMSMAKRNEAEAKRKAANIHLLPESGRPVRADPKQVKLKEGVAKFLAKQAEDERKKKEQEKLKKDKLLQLRQQDRKATNRVRKMLSMTKSANKSCVEDARDCLNESVAAQGEFQPDEDDYGYTSNYADMMHKKMMEKYKSIPVKPAFPQERGVNVPKHQSLSKNGTGWRKNGSAYEHEDERAYSSPEQEEPKRHYDEPAPSSHRKPEKPSKPNRPPPVDYRVLLQMAQEKQFEPAAPTKPIIEKKGELEEYEFGRPMTAKEKKAYLEKKEWMDRLARRMEGKSDNNNNSSNSNGTSIGEPKNGKMPSFKIPRSRPNNDDTPSSAVPPPKKPRVSEPEPSSLSRPSKEISKPVKSSEPNGNSGSLKSSVMPQGKPNGMRPFSSRPIEKSQKQNSLSSSSPAYSSPAHSSKAKVDPQRDRQSVSSQQHKTDSRSEKVIQERKELIKEKPRYLSAFDGGKEKDREMDRDNQRKQPLLSKDSNKSRPGSSRDMHPSNREEKSYDSREKIRFGTAPKNNQDYSDRNRPLKRDRDDVPPTKRDMAPPTKRDAGPAPRRDMAQPSRRDMEQPAKRDIGQPPRRDMGQPPRRDMGQPPRRDMGQPPRRDMGQPPRRDAGPAPRRDTEPPPRREMPMKGHSRMRGDSPPRMRPPVGKPYRGRAVIDSDEEEYDSEMDDFIDDSEVDMGNISAEISRIFKYDRRKYHYEESDDECMESSVAEQLREEQRSLRIGIQEDLEDMAREEEEKRRAKMKMKKKR